MEKGYTKKKYRRKIPKVGRSYKRHLKEDKTFDKSVDINDLVEEVLMEKGGPGSGRRGSKTTYSEDLKNAIKRKDSKAIKELLSMKMPQSLVNKEYKRIIQENNMTKSVEQEIDEMAENMEIFQYHFPLAIA